MSFSISYPWWFIILCFASGVLVSFLLYYKKRNNFTSLWAFALAAIARCFAFSMLAFLLLAPIIKRMSSTTEKPILFFLQDNSASQKAAFKKIDSTSYRNNIQQQLSLLQKDFTVKTYSFGNSIKDTARYTYTEQQSDISGAIEKIVSTHENENIGAIIMASDGIYNSGNNPALSSPLYNGSMYTIGIGDTTTQKDASVLRVYANKIVYLADKFSIRSDIAVLGASGSTASVSIFNHNSSRVIQSQSFGITNNRFSKSIETIIDATAQGIQHYTITISKLLDEQNIANNVQDVYVEVIDAKEKVLIVGNAPHPDLNALQEAISKNKNYKVDVTTADRMKNTITDYNLVILHNIPSVNYNGTSIIEQAKAHGISIWYILGAQSAIPLVNKAQDAVQINASGIFNDVAVNVNPAFSYFTISNKENITQLPPLALPIGTYKLGNNAQTLMLQRATQNSIWTLQQGSTARIGVLAGEGIWRWRLYDYKQHKNYTTVDDYINKTVKYLSVKNDKRPFRATMQKSIFAESEPLFFDAELYNANYELVNTPDVSLSILDEQNKKYTYSMNKNDQTYSLNIGNLAAGVYNYVASTNYSGKNYTSTGTFKVIKQNIEDVNTTADFGMLYQLAKNYNGAFLQAKEISTLAEKIKANTQIKNIVRTELKTNPLIDMKWLFAIPFILLAIEWFLRKRNGNY